MKQLKLLLKTITSPRSAFRELPSNKIYALAFIGPLYYAVDRAFRPDNYERYIKLLGSDAAILVSVVVFGAILLPIGSWILQQILKLFKKRLSVYKLMNISGYALVPRLVVTGIGFLMLLVWPDMLAEGNEIPTQLILLAVLGLLALLYSLFLFIYGIVVSPSEEKAIEAPPLEETHHTPSSTNEE